MTYYKVPMLIDVIRLTGSTVDATVSNLVNYYRTPAGGWSHQRAARFMRYGFDGAGDQAALVKACRGDGRKAFLDNAKIAEAALPLIVGRKAQSFSFPRTRLIIAPDLRSLIGPAFFVVEDGIVRLIYLHARNEERASTPDLAAFAILARREILDNDFYGLPGDIEIHCVDKTGANRTDIVLRLAGLEVHLREPVEATVSRFVQAFSLVDANRLAGPLSPRKRKEQPENTDQPEFEF